MKLNEDKTRIVQAFGVLDKLDTTTTPVQITCVGPDGQSQTFEATPEVIQGMKSGLSGALFGKTKDWSEDLRFDSVDDVAQALSVDKTDLDGLAAHYGGDGGTGNVNQRFDASQIIPFLHQNVDQRQEARSI